MWSSPRAPRGRPVSRGSESPLSLPSPYIEFDPVEWSRFRANVPLTLGEDDLADLSGINERVSLTEVEAIYLPLSRLLSLYVAATQDLYRATSTFLGSLASKVPYVIGLGGSVAVGKSTTARILQELLRRWPDHPKVDLVPTDGFLYPNSELEERGLMNRKGFPESYDQRALVDFVSRVKAGDSRVESPVYSHLVYDIVPDRTITIESPDILIIEGLNVLQSGGARSDVFVSDYFDFKVYVEANPTHIREWYIDRFLTLRGTAFADERSYFHRYAAYDDAAAQSVATELWDTINEPNLRENIAPTRGRADLILTKAKDHSIERVSLRRL